MIPVVRRPDLDFSDVRRDWFDGNLLISLRTDALHLLFPSGEQFFVRSVLRFRDRLSDPELVERVRAFAGQEAMHGKLHEAAFEALESQGYEYRSALEAYEHLAWKVLEPWGSDVMKLSVTAALEHLTASFAARALVDGRIDGMDAPMSDLMRWHAAEEIEHRDVAFDVLTAVDGRYVVRAAGMIAALVGLGVMWSRLFFHLKRQTPELTPERLRQERAALAAKGWTHRFILPRALRYLKPGYHPRDEDLDPLATQALQTLGLIAA